MNLSLVNLRLVKLRLVKLQPGTRLLPPNSVQAWAAFPSRSFSGLSRAVMLVA